MDRSWVLRSRKVRDPLRSSSRSFKEDVRAISTLRAMTRLDRSLWIQKRHHNQDQHLWSRESWLTRSEVCYKINGRVYCYKPSNTHRMAAAAKKDRYLGRQQHSLLSRTRRRSLNNCFKMSYNDHPYSIVSKDLRSTYKWTTASVAADAKSWEALAWPGFGTSYQRKIAQMLSFERHFCINTMKSVNM